MIVCIDTNVVLGMFGRGAPWLVLRQALFSGRFRWAISTEILLEYEEVTAREMGTAQTAVMLRFIELLQESRRNILYISPDFRFHTIPADADDDQFADCAIVAQADYVITADRHFRTLATAGYQPQPITPEEFTQRHLTGW